MDDGRGHPVAVEDFGHAIGMRHARREHQRPASLSDLDGRGDDLVEHLLLLHDRRQFALVEVPGHGADMAEVHVLDDDLLRLDGAKPPIVHGLHDLVLVGDGLEHHAERGLVGAVGRGGEPDDPQLGVLREVADDPAIGVGRRMVRLVDDEEVELVRHELLHAVEASHACAQGLHACHDDRGLVHPAGLVLGHLDVRRLPGDGADLVRRLLHQFLTVCDHHDSALPLPRDVREAHGLARPGRHDDQCGLAADDGVDDPGDCLDLVWPEIHPSPR